MVDFRTRRSGFLVLAGTILALAAPRAADAQTQVKPYVMVVFDNSGSMCDLPSGARNCLDVTSPLIQAKRALRNIVSSAGDMIFGLARYHSSCSSCTNCTFHDCGGCGTGPRCPTNACYLTNDGDILVGLAEDNQNQIIQWVNETCGGGDAAADPELTGITWTPIHGTLDTTLRYYTAGGTWLSTFTSPIATDPYRGCRPYYVVALTDGEETCGGCPQTGATALRSARVTSLPCTTVADCCPGGTCRTTGAGTPGCVGGFCQYDIQTWAIGFRIAAPNTMIENIASAGGTDCPGTPLGCYASDSAGLSAALSNIVASSILVEVCDGVDNDCDGEIDEGFSKYCNRPGHPAQDLCVDPGETLCNGVDDNCNGLTDEGLLNTCGSCGTLPPDTCDHIDNDCDGATDEDGPCTCPTPGPEICDNADNDCDTLTDEGLTRPCGTSIGQCRPGTQTCSAGTWGVCAGETPPATELCNNLDDDCDGRTDGFTRNCGTDAGVCEFGTELCSAGRWGGCIGGYSGGAEVCNLLDDDCDGSTDEGDPGGGGECGGAVGECRPGTRHCVGGTLVCSGGSEPVPELCDTLDNDCDGATDEGNPGGGGSCYSGPAGTDGVGVCEGGVLRCIGGALVCDGELLPRAEDCNNLDDDCDTATDEELPTGGTCGTNDGECTAGTRSCVAGAWVCEGEVGPTDEICDLLDNDCDTATDEANPGGAVPCGWDPDDPSVWDLGICEPGISNCIDGVLTCEAMIGPRAEECNALDDDCDGETDEGLSIGEACGLSEGECEPGTLQCFEGTVQCIGGIGPTPEICDCLDNDCDVQTDEGSECPGSAACVDCTCASECFGLELECAVGRECRCDVIPEDPTACFCMPVRIPCGAGYCESASCQVCGDPATETCIDRACGECQKCQMGSGECVDICLGVDCAAGTACVCVDGVRTQCLPPDCYTPGRECPAGEQCDPDPATGRGHCVDDPCYDTSCDPPQFCRDGTCHDPCEVEDVCAACETCYDGSCRTDLCCDVTCTAGTSCDPATGACTDRCAAAACAWPLTCDPATGNCEEPDCWDIDCPEGYDCVDGTCVEREGPADDEDAGDGDAAGDAAQPGVQVLATGAGGCSCRMPATGFADGGGLLLLALALLGAARRRRGKERKR